MCQACSLQCSGALPRLRLRRADSCSLGHGRWCYGGQSTGDETELTQQPGLIRKAGALSDELAVSVAKKLPNLRVNSTGGL